MGAGAAALAADGRAGDAEARWTLLHVRAREPCDPLALTPDFCVVGWWLLGMRFAMPGTDLGVPGIVMSTGIAAVPPLAPDVLPMHQQWKPRGGSLNPPPIFLAAGGMKVLVSMLQSPEEKVQLQAVGALSEACNGNPSNQVPFPLRPLPPPQPVVAKQTQDSARHGKMVTWSGASGTDGVGERGGHAGAGAAHAQWDRHGSVQGRRCHLRRLHGLPPASRLLLSVADCGTTRTSVSCCVGVC